MDANDWNVIRRALIKLFRQLAPPSDVVKDEWTNVKAVCRLNRAAWRALSGTINQLPEVANRGLTISPDDMEIASTVHDIELLLRGSAARREENFVSLPHFEIDHLLRLPGAPSVPPPPPKSPQPTPLRAAVEKLDQAEYTVWYGTSRRPNDPSDANKSYSAQRDLKVHYGTCSVYIPKSHKIGSIGSPWWKRLITMTDDRLKLTNIEEAAEANFWRNVAAHLDAVGADDRDAVIYVHGYRVTFEDAALRAAQIGFDLSIKGVMAFFSWPSQGTVAGYPADEATIEANEDMISEFMLKFAAQSHARAVHIIAHSMGNRGVLRAINRIAQEVTLKSGIPFGQIILAAADVDVDTFRNLCAAYTKLAKRTTLYVSRRDLAVESSQWLHGFPRVGLIPPIFVTPGIDTINVTNADLTALGHGYIASARGVLQDMHDLIFHGAPPERRFGLRPMRTEDGSGYWLIGR